MKSEHQIQTEVIQYCDTVLARKYPQYHINKHLKCQYNMGHFAIYAPPNGGKRARITGSTLKKEGQRRGVPDLIMPIQQYAPFVTEQFRGLTIFPGLIIEMKKPKGRTSKEQREWLAFFESQGYQTAVCFSAQEAIDVIEGYLK